jgi:hypothetical protein
MGKKQKKKTEYRIDGWEQLRIFYGKVFSGELDLRPHHVSLYQFLLHQNNRNMWAEWFKCPFDLAMTGACIGSRQTYYKSLKYLQECKLIKYIPGINDYKAPRISIIPLLSKNEHQFVPLSEPVIAPVIDNQSGPVPQQLPEQVLLQLPGQLPEHIYKQITNNINNIITSNWDSIKNSNVVYKFFIGKNEITEIKKYYEKKFPRPAGQLKKEYGADFYNDSFKEFLEINNNKRWKNDEDLRKHFISYIAVRKKNKDKGSNQIKNSSSHERTIEELKNEYQV